MCSLSNSSRVSLDRVKEITGVQPAFTKLDLRDAAALESFLSSQPKPFDACIHFAGLKAVGESSAIPLDYYESNVSGSINLFKALEKVCLVCLRCVFIVCFHLAAQMHAAGVFVVCHCVWNDRASAD